MRWYAGHEDHLLEADPMNDDDSSKHVSSTFRGVYKRKFDTKWRAEITAGAAHLHSCLLMPAVPCHASITRSHHCLPTSYIKYVA